MIVVDHVTKKYLAHHALSDCSFQIQQGNIIGIIGENGSGKTTLLKLLVGLLRPSSGRVLIDGEIVTRKISEKVAYLSDLDYFFSYFTINELMRFYDSQFTDFDRTVACNIAEFMDLPLHKKVSHLSKGNRGRVKMTVTFARRAPYIILDEPFAGLDPLVRKKIIHSMIKFTDLDRQTLIITTHDLKEIQPILDEVILLREGKVLAHDNVENIRERDKVDLTGWMEMMYQTTKST